MARTSPPFIALVLVQLAMLARIGTLDVKPAWKDEVYSLTRAAGYRIERTISRELHQQTTTAAALQKYLDPANTPRTWDETWVALKSKPEHPPLYFLLLRAWASVSDGSIEDLRQFSVAVGGVLFFTLFRLARALFNDENAGWGVLTFAASSPILLRYSQEIRHYGLWLLLATITTTCLVETLDRSSDDTSGKRRWWKYAAWTTVAGSTHLLTATLTIVHGAIVAAWSIGSTLIRDRRRTCLAWLTSVAFAMAASAPWPLMALAKEGYFRKPAAFARFADPAPAELVSSWLQQSLMAIVALPESLPLGVVLLAASGVVTATIAAAIWLWRLSERRAVMVAGSMTLLPFLLVAVPDIVLGGARSTVSRYFLLSFVGAIVLLGGALSQLCKKMNVQQFCVTVCMFLAIYWLNLSYVERETWEAEALRTTEFARVISEQPNTLLISDAPLAELLAIATELKPDRLLLWLDENREIDLQLPPGQLLIHTREDSTLYEQFKGKFAPEIKTPDDRAIVGRDGYVLWQVENSEPAQLTNPEAIDPR